MKQIQNSEFVCTEQFHRDLNEKGFSGSPQFRICIIHFTAAFGKEIGNEILAVAMYQCCEGTALYLGGDWADDTTLGEQKLTLSSASLSRLCSNIGADEAGRNEFFRGWIAQCKYPRALVHD